VQELSSRSRPSSLRLLVFKEKRRESRFARSAFGETRKISGRQKIKAKDFKGRPEEDGEDS
jgi:hypothetical protein